MATTTRLLWDNETLGSSVVVTSSTEATGYQDDYVTNRARWKKWRSATSTADQWVKYDLTANKTLKTIFVVNYKAHTGGTIKVQAHATDSWGTPTVDETLTLPSLDLTGVAGAFFSSQSLRWVRIFFDNVTPVSEYVELGVAFAGDHLEPSKSIISEFPFRRVDPSRVIRALDGQEEVQARSKYHEFSGLFRYRMESEKDDFAEAFDTIGAGIPFFFILDITDPHLQFYGRFREALNLDHIDLGWDIPFNFMESL
jgi:hypothetical protein